MRYSMMTLLLVCSCDRSSIEIGSRPGPVMPATSWRWSASTYPGDDGAPNLVSGDFDGNGTPDLAEAGLHGITTLLNDGHGHFQAVTTPGSWGWLATGDFNHDGKLDLISLGAAPVSPPQSLNRDMLLMVLTGNGDGTFATGASYVSSQQWLEAAGVADLNGDGRLDVVYSQNATSAVQGAMSQPGRFVGVRLGNGNGTFGSEQLFDAGDNWPGAAVLGDFNGDQKLDVIVAVGQSGYKSSPSPGLMFLRGNGDGTFAPAQSVALLDTTDSVWITTGEINGDKQLDLFVGSRSGIEVLPGLGGGAFGPVASRTPVSFGAAVTFAVADVNGDQNPDLIVPIYKGEDVLGIALGTGDGSFGPFATMSIGHIDAFALPLDLDGDGSTDIAVVEQWSQDVRVLLNNPKGSVTRQVGRVSEANP